MGLSPWRIALAGVDDEAATAAGLHRLHKAVQVFKAVQIIDAEAVLDGHRNAAGCLHLAQALRHPLRMGHQAGADHVVLHPVGGAAHVQVDFVVAGFFRHAAAGGQRPGIAASELESQRVLAVLMVQKTVAVAMDQGAGGDHFRVEQRMAGDQPVKDTAVGGGPVHHRGHGEAALRAGRGARLGGILGGPVIDRVRVVGHRLDRLVTAGG